MTGLDQVRTVICDSHTATLLPAWIPAIRFELLAEESIADVQRTIRGGAA